MQEIRPRKTAGNVRRQGVGMRAATGRVLRTAVFITLIGLGPVSKTDGIAHAVTSDLCVRITGRGPVRLRDNGCRSTELKIGSFDGSTMVLQLTGINLQVVSGSGATDGAVNGRGNIIIGYNEDVDSPSGRGGSHNLVIGPEHTFDSFGGIVAGVANSITGANASITGGANNVASGDGASVSGGKCNIAGPGPAPFCVNSPGLSSISGGIGNVASGDQSSVCGGEFNIASGEGAAVSGGNGNTASGAIAWVGGGTSNTASAGGSTVTGGAANTASTGSWPTVTGGRGNLATGDYATVSGGNSRTASGVDDWVAGGLFQDF